MKSLRLAMTAVLFAAPLSAQGTIAARADIAFLNPDTAKSIHLAYDLGAGIEVGRRYTFLLDYARQNLSGMIQGYAASWVTMLGGAFEYALGDARLSYRRQFTLGLRGGMMQPHGPYLSAPYVGFAAGFRYPVNSFLRIDGHIEDVVAFLPRQNATVCDVYGDCFTSRVGGNAQQNFGVFLGFEFHPTTPGL